MPQNFLACDREQELLLPPSLREWLPEDHLAWFVIDAVAAMDLAAFYVVYRADGHGRAAHEPAMMVALLLYAYATGERSSRRIERRCSDDVATRVICEPAARSHDDRAVPSAPRNRAGRPVRRGPRALRRRWPGPRRGRGDRRHQGPRERVEPGDAQLRGHRARDPGP